VIGSLAVAVLLLAAPQAVPPEGSPAPAPKAPPAVTPPSAPVVTFEDLWAGLVKAEASGDAAASERAFREIRRLRVERNIDNLDSLGLGLVARGLERLEAGEREPAEEAMRSAVGLAPGLPDGHYGLARALLKKGPLGVLPSIEVTLAGIAAFLPTGRGGLNARDLATVAGLLLTWALAWGLGGGLLVRRGGLLRHDIEEWLGPAQSRSASLALFLLLLLLPVATFQGWGWLPLWWLALVFSYLGLAERALTALLLLGVVAVGPTVASLEHRHRTARNPLYWAALEAVEGVPDRNAIVQLERAARADPQDRDLLYLLGVARKRAGRYAEAAELFRQLLAADPGDAIARNNLANIEFVWGAYETARARYEAGTKAAASPDVAATSYYNLSLAHLQKFDYNAFNEAKATADRLARGLVADYDRWKYDSGDYAVVDLVLTREQEWDKFAGADTGVAVRNVVAGGQGTRAASALQSVRNRFAASVGIFAVVAFLVGRWRGPKAFTLHCARCGTAFCRSCHLGQVSGGLCSQCYHMFVVRDGVSSPARNRKMAEVQRAEARRSRIFRLLSVVAPGAGQVYGGWPLRGALLLAVWFAVGVALLAARVTPLTEVSPRLASPWLPLAAGAGLLAVWLTANRFRPESDVELPARPPGARRARAQGAA
jgi:tetratricopeptide (TPR) repeat protein